MSKLIVNSDRAFKDAVQALAAKYKKDRFVVVELSTGKVGKWGMARLWRSWMSSIAEYMANNGAVMPLVMGKDGSYKKTRPFNAEDAHELFTYHCLGEDENGNRLSWSKSGHDGMRPATKGERLHAMRQVEQWALERGIKLFNPQDSEYNQLTGRNHDSIDLD